MVGDSCEEEGKEEDANLPTKPLYLYSATNVTNLNTTNMSAQVGKKRSLC